MQKKTNKAKNKRSPTRTFVLPTNQPAGVWAAGAMLLYAMSRVFSKILVIFQGVTILANEFFKGNFLSLSYLAAGIICSD